MKISTCQAFILFAFPAAVAAVSRVVYSLACFCCCCSSRRQAVIFFRLKKFFRLVVCVFSLCRYARLHVSKTTTATTTQTNSKWQQQKKTKTNNQHKSLNCQQLLKRVIMSQSTSTSASASNVASACAPTATGATERERDPKNSFLKCQRLPKKILSALK